MEELETKKYAGIDLSRTSVQFSIYREGQEEMTEESFPLSEEEQKEYIESGMRQVERYMETGGLRWPDFQAVHFSMEDASEENRGKLKSAVSEEFRKLHGVKVITHFRAFAEYVFHQERIMWDRNTLLLDYHDNQLSYVLIDQIRRSKQKAYRALQQRIDLNEYRVAEGTPEQDQNFGQMMKRFLVKNPANIIFLTGSGFEGNWMKKTLTYLCAGRRVFLGQNLYANGACLLGIHSIELMDEGMILMDGPDMVTILSVPLQQKQVSHSMFRLLQLEENGIIHMEVWILFLIKVREWISFTIIRKRMKLREPPVISKDFRSDRQRQQESALKSALPRRQRE